MQTNYHTRFFVALFACVMFLSAFTAAPLVHKHAPTEQVPLKDYDATCSWVKAEKNSSTAPTQFLLVCASLLLFFIATDLAVSRRTAENITAHSIFERKVQPPRAPPAV